MPRRLNLRQIEAFKAVIENGTISRAAEVLHISQPAMSKLVAHLEFDTGLHLFDRVKGRLAPSEQAMRLYDEVGRIFSGVRQVEAAVEAIRREEQGRLAIGVLPALATSFVQRVTTGFLRERPKIFCSVQSLASHLCVDWLIARKLDIGLVSGRTDNPYVTLEPLIELPLVCIMARDHPLTERDVIQATHLDGLPFVAFHSDIYVSHVAREMFDEQGVNPQIALMTNNALTLCEFVAAGVGVSLVHPLMIGGLETRLEIRRFEPSLPYSFQLCRSANSRNAHIVDAFVEQLREKAAAISASVLAHPMRRASEMADEGATVMTGAGEPASVT